LSDLLKLAEELGKFTSHDKVLYLKTEPEINDFTKPFTGKIHVFGEKLCLTIPSHKKEDISNLFHQLCTTVLSEGMTVIFWNLKSLVSYFRFQLPRTPVHFDAKWVDLKLIEGFFGSKLAAPGSLNEALRRLGPYTQNEAAKRIHKVIHKPLALQVVPEMETASLVIDTELKKYVYSSYEIESQTTGRLGCHKNFDTCITPHNMGDDQKFRMKLRNEKDFYVHFDFKHMEVSVLQWLSKDAALKSILDQYDDLYKGIYQNILGQPCDTEDKRNLIKSIFLPVMFGLQPAGLVDKLQEGGINFSLNAATQLHQVIRQKFKTAWEYLTDYHNQAKSSAIVLDYFGRPRSFAEKPLSVRGFLVQSAAAVMCLEKLIDLNAALGDCGKLLYSIHDGYVLVANQEKLNKVVSIGLKTLQGPSTMCPDLRLKVSCSIGIRLSHMKQIPMTKEKSGNGS
jgi:hypothetical protein